MKHFSRRSARSGQCLALLAGLFLSVSANAAALSQPAGLAPEIGFWRAVFGEITSSQAAIHDNRHLGVVYEVVDLPARAGSAQRRKIASDARKRYRRILLALADGKRQGLTTEQRRVLDLWPAEVSNQELRKAAERIRFQQGLADRFRDGYVRSGQWRAHILRQLDEQGVPAGLAALPHVESSFNPRAHSHVGASGLWQFTRATGRRFMQVDHVVDARRDPFISSEGAAKLLAYNYSILKSWPLAITAYNHGVAGMRRAVRSVGSDDIETIIREYRGPAFGFASRNFFVAFLAALEVESNVERYFGPLQRETPRPELMIAMPDYVPAEQLADAFGVSMDTLKVFNPALLPPVWSGTKHVPRGYALRLPLPDGEYASERQLAAIPARVRFDQQTPDLFHRIESGESLSVIARRYRTSVTELMALNGIDNRHRIRAGQRLRLPVSDTYAGTVMVANTQSYRVRSGDTVGSIAKRAGVSQSELLAINGIRDRNRIFVGQTLQLRSPAGGESVAVAVNTPAGEALEPVMVTASLLEMPVAADRATMDLAGDLAPADEQPQAQAENDALLADPSDYLVSDGGSIEVQAAETLGHYADWLEIKTQRLRDLNGYSFRRPVVIGQRLKLDLSRIDAQEFAARRVAHHRALQASYFNSYRVIDTTVHKLRRGESVWLLTMQTYRVPVWLLRQYNPDLDIDRLRPGDPLIFPQVEPVETASPKRGVLADAS
jgi:membrane-bound lytic murein transglycosylase D